jgi:hypothetical protein
MASRSRVNAEDDTDSDDEFQEVQPHFEGQAPDWEIGAQSKSDGWIEVTDASGMETDISIAAVAYYSAHPRGDSGSIGLVTGHVFTVPISGGILQLREMLRAPAVDPLGTKADTPYFGAQGDPSPDVPPTRPTTPMR